MYISLYKYYSAKMIRENPRSRNRILAIFTMLVFMGFVSCLRRTRRCGDEHEAKSMDAMIVKSGEFLFRDLGK